LNRAVGGGWMAPNEARAARGLAPVKGGESPKMQQQVFSLEALAERDRSDPFAKPAAPTPAPDATPTKGVDNVYVDLVRGESTTRKTTNHNGAEIELLYPGRASKWINGELMTLVWDGSGNETWVPDRMFLDRGDDLSYSNKWTERYVIDPDERSRLMKDIVNK